MANSTRVCRVCGKEYPYCKTAIKDDGMFRWQDVACCKEHGSKYFTKILLSRSDDSSTEIDDPITIDDGIYVDDDDDNDDGLDYFDEDE